MEQGRLTRVLVVDDHPLVVDGLAAIIGAQPDMTVAWQAGTGDEAVALFREHRPDVTLMDIRLPDRDGIAAITAIRSFAAQARFLVLSNHEGDEDIHRALAAGALGYLFKNTARRDVVAAIRAVAAGQRYLPPAVAMRLAERVPRADLSAREVEVLKLVAAGLRNKEIAAALGISEFTVKDHVQNILGKLHASDRTQAVTVALQRGILHLT